MNIDKIKNSLIQYLNVSMDFTYYGSRGQNEKFRGKIINLYPRIFIIECENGAVKSFSYSDFAINHLKIH